MSPRSSESVCTGRSGRGFSIFSVSLHTRRIRARSSVLSILLSRCRSLWSANAHTCEEQPSCFILVGIGAVFVQLAAAFSECFFAVERAFDGVMKLVRPVT